jgi:hypothetical protein
MRSSFCYHFSECSSFLKLYTFNAGLKIPQDRIKPFLELVLRQNPCAKVCLEQDKTGNKKIIKSQSSNFLYINLEYIQDATNIFTKLNFSLKIFL